MSAPRRLMLPSERLPIDGGIVSLDPDKRRYLRKVLRLDVGARVDVRDGRGGEWPARITGRGELTLEPRVQLKRPQIPGTTLSFCPPKGRRLDLLLEKATELGAYHLRPIRVERTVRIVEDPNERWAAIIAAAGSQSGAPFLPTVGAPVPLPEALENSTGLRLLAHPGGAPLASVLETLERPEHIEVFTGPEGGFTDSEVAEAKRAGAEIVGLAPTILRAETAPIVALSTILARYWRA